jgi:hypothetical protein
MQSGVLEESQEPNIGAFVSSIPEVMAMKTMKTDRSGYRSPIVEDTEGNHSSG